MISIWTPTLAGRSGPKAQQIADAIGDAIRSGELRQGVRLPPQRDLADALGVSPNTVSRAYARAIERGLVQGEVGRGTYVRGPAPLPEHARSGDLVRSNSGPIDFSRNLPAPGAAAEALAATLGEMQHSPKLQSFLDYQTSQDMAHHVQAATAWLERCGVSAASREIVITCGAQHGIMAALTGACRPGDVLLVEELTYAPVKAMAARLGLKLAPVTMDGSGICPDALEALCETHTIRALYCTPNLQTPTTITLSPERRRHVAAIARKYDVLIIQDDVFGPLLETPDEPFTCLAPDNTIYITSTSKCLAPGLRVGYVRAAPRYVAALREAVNLTCWMTPPLMAEVAARWILDGAADAMVAAQRTAASKRQQMARSMLGAFRINAPEIGFHLWLELPEHWKAEAFQAAAAARGVLVTQGAAFAVQATNRPNAVRLGLTHEPSEGRVLEGLTILRELLEEFGTNSDMIL